MLERGKTCCTVQSMGQHSGLGTKVQVCAQAQGQDLGEAALGPAPGIAGSWLFWDLLALLALHLVEGGEDADLGISPEREAAQGPQWSHVSDLFI